MKALRDHTGLWEDPSFLDADLTDSNCCEEILGRTDGGLHADDLRMVQRLLRVTETAEDALTLLELGYRSAASITATAKSVFVRELQGGLGSSARARKIHDAARLTRNRAAHAIANAHDVAAAERNGLARVSNVSDQVQIDFQNLSGYQEIFGSLNYCTCAQCQSILGPAAYLVDLLRIIDRAVTVPNRSRPSSQAAAAAFAKYESGGQLTKAEKRIVFDENIPPGLRFGDRRPDIGNMALTCANTNHEVPYLELVVQLLETVVTKAWASDGVLVNDDVYLTLATRLFPFNLPYNDPLAALRSTLSTANLPLSDLYFALTPIAIRKSGPTLAWAREYLGMSQEQLANIEPPTPPNLASRVSANYGLTVTQGNLHDLDHLAVFLKQTGLELENADSLFQQGLGIQEFRDVSGEYSTTGRGSSMALSQRGEKIIGSYDVNNGTLSGVLSGNTLFGTWTETNSGSSQSGEFYLDFASDGSSFSGAWSPRRGAPWGKTPWDGQRKSGSPSLWGMIPHALYINKSLAANTYLHIHEDSTSPNNSYLEIVGQSLASLDHLNRFIRLSQLLGWTYEDLDWVLTTLSPPSTSGGTITATAELDRDTIIEIAKIRQITKGHGLPLDDAVSLWFDLRTTGVGQGTESAAPFDRVFNPGLELNPAGPAPYHPSIAAASSSFPNPLYQDGPVSWALPSTSASASVTSTTPSPAEQIVGKLPVSLLDAAKLAAGAFPGNSSVKLTVPNLSLLYRHAMLANAMGLSVDAYLAFLKLCGLWDKRFPAILDRSDTLKLLVANQQLQVSPIGVEQAAYFVDGTPSQTVNPGYQSSQVPAFLGGLMAKIAPTLASEAMFEKNGALPGAAQAVLQFLTNSGYLDNIGLVVLDATAHPPDLSALPDYSPHPNPITLADIQKALGAAAGAQRLALGTALAGLISTSSDRATLLIDGAVAWLGLKSTAETLLADPILSAAASGLVSGEALDIAAVESAFRTAKISFSGDLSVVTVSVTVWQLKAGQDIYRAFLTGGMVVFYSSGQSGLTELFSVDATTVIQSGSLDPADVKAAFAAHKHPLTSLPTVNPLVKPTAWTLKDEDQHTFLARLRNQDIEFSAPIADSSGSVETIPKETGDAIGFIARLSMLGSSLNLDSAGIELVARFPMAVAGESDSGHYKPTLETVQAAIGYQALNQSFGAKPGALTDYFQTVWVDPGKPVVAPKKLAELTGWTAEQISALTLQLFQVKDACSTIADLQALNTAVGMAAELGGAPSLLLDAYAAQNASTDPAGFTELRGLTIQLQDNLHHKVGAAAWPQTSAQLSGTLDEQRRDAFVTSAIVALQAVYPDIARPAELYEFLLIDVEMSGCAMISPIKQALNAAQLYLQRCRLNLERNVTIDPDDLHPTWFEWLMSYRVWQANREIFLYPENYIDPTLRKSKTALFSALENALQQGNKTETDIEMAFRQQYVNELVALTKLVPVDAYSASMETADNGTESALMLFTRTHSQPYQFYLSKRTSLGESGGEPAYLWTGIQKIDITINSEYVTPVFAFRRLFIFWVELKEKKEQINDPKNLTERFHITTASIKYSYLNLAGQWIQPQTMIHEQVVKVIAKDSLLGPFSDEFSDVNAPYWQKVSAISVDDPEERIVVSYGPFVDQEASGASPGTVPPNYLTNADVAEFHHSIEEAVFVKGQLAGLEVPGRTPLVVSQVANGDLENSMLAFQNQYVLLTPTVRSKTSGPGFRASLNGSALPLTNSVDNLYNNFVIGGEGPVVQVLEANADISAQSLVSSTIDAASADAFYAILSKAGPGQLIVPDSTTPTVGKVVKAALDVSISLLQAAIQAPSFAIAREVWEVMVSYYLGSPLLFATTSPTNSSLWTVKNQPGMILVRSGTESFLLEGSTKSTSFPRAAEAMSQSKPTAALTPSAFVNRTISTEQSVNFFSILSKQPNKYISDLGVVDEQKVKNGSVALLATLLDISIGEAQQVRDVLLTGSGPASLEYSPGNFDEKDTVYALQFQTLRLSSGSANNLSDALFSGGLSAMLALPMQQAPINVTSRFDDLTPINQTYPASVGSGKPYLTPPRLRFDEQVDFDGPYGNYYWELFFHAPMLIAKTLHDDQQYSRAETWLQYVFDPTLAVSPLTETAFVNGRPNDIDESLAKKFYADLTAASPPLIDDSGSVTSRGDTISVADLKGILASDEVQAIEVGNLLKNRYLVRSTSRYWRFEPFRNHTPQSLKQQLTNAAEIATYNDDPFDPHAIARLRISAYEKAAVMAYVKNLIDWGDSEFAKYSWESITTARMLYIYALEILGPAPEDLGDCSAEYPLSFDDILASYGDDPAKIPQFYIDVENYLPNLGESAEILSSSNGPFNDIGGYFCVPNNTQLGTYWATIKDRLYKIRHCENLEGQYEALPLFQPPINPMALVQAAAAGGNVLAAASSLQARLPNYRFETLIARAKEAVQMVEGFGAAVLAALEKKDAEALAQLRASQETALLQLITTAKLDTLNAEKAQQAALQQTLQSAEIRESFYAGLISGGLSAAEIANITLLGTSMISKAAAIPFHGLAIAGYLVPDIYGFSDGGMKFGDAINAGAQIANAIGDIAGTGASLSGIVGGFERRGQDWSLQKQIAASEIQSVNHQITASSARVAAAEQDLETTRKQISQSQGVETFLRDKFTNEALYQWMIGRVSTVYSQAFQLAKDLALSSQVAYAFELDRSDEFVTFEYWDNLKAGLMAGQGLNLALQQMENAYLQNNDRRLEIEKTISLRQLFPEAFLAFQWGAASSQGAGQLHFSLAEGLFDRDYPGHYQRKIKSVSVSVPSVIGPYQDIHATLTQTSNVVVEAPDIAAVKQLVDSGQQSTVTSLRRNWGVMQEIAISRGVDDFGLFDADVHDARYLPFEGTGAVSSWVFEMQPADNRINLADISDIVIKVNYTARSGGSGFAQQVRELYQGASAPKRDDYYALFAVASAFSTNWWEFLHGKPTHGEQSLAIEIDSDVVLPNLSSAKLTGVLVQLRLAGDQNVDGSGQDAFIGLQVDGAPAQPIMIDVTNNIGKLDASELSAVSSKFAGQPWKISFDLAKTPKALLTNGQLDSEVLQNLALVLTYQASPA